MKRHGTVLLQCIFDMMRLFLTIRMAVMTVMTVMAVMTVMTVDLTVMIQIQMIRAAILLRSLV